MADSTQSAGTATAPGVARIKNIIAVASGKGGVGKSTVAANLALALRHLGAKVGLMDGDIYGPSQPGMLGGLGTRPEVGDGFLYPVTKHGIDFVSMGLFMDENTPVVWRGPMATKMIQQFIGAVQWGELDYLLIDLPPGTGDVQITLAQTASLTGAVIVTTPQQVALEVAKRGVKMFSQVNVPVLGIIENMSGFTCPDCGHLTRIFKTGGGKDLADNLGLPFLGALPLDPEIMASGEEGAPLVTRDPETPAAKAFLDLAASVKKAAAMVSGSGDTFRAQKFEVTPEGNLALQWTPSDKRELGAYDLRVKCPCASCVDEDTGQRTLDPKQVSLDIKIKNAGPVGRYGIAIAFSDGHDTGIYRFDYLREIEKEVDSGGDKSSFDV